MERPKQCHGSVRRNDERRFLKFWNAMKSHLNFDMDKNRKILINAYILAPKA